MCYDTRLRNLASETSLTAASEAFADVRRRLRTMTGEGTKVDGARKVKLKALTPECVEVESTWDREVSVVRGGRRWGVAGGGLASRGLTVAFVSCSLLATNSALVLRPPCQ